MGFDFNPYLQRIFHTVDRNWRVLMPESVYPPILKKGIVFIEFSIMKDGSVQGKKVVGPPADVTLVRADAERVSREGTLGWFWRRFRVVAHYCHAITIATLD